MLYGDTAAAAPAHRAAGDVGDAPAGEGGPAASASTPPYGSHTCASRNHDDAAAAAASAATRSVLELRASGASVRMSTSFPQCTDLANFINSRPRSTTGG